MNTCKYSWYIYKPSTLISGRPTAAQSSLTSPCYFGDDNCNVGCMSQSFCCKRDPHRSTQLGHDVGRKQLLKDGPNVLLHSSEQAVGTMAQQPQISRNTETTIVRVERWRGRVTDQKTSSTVCGNQLYPPILPLHAHIVLSLPLTQYSEKGCQIGHFPKRSLEVGSKPAPLPPPTDAGMY